MDEDGVCLPKHGRPPLAHEQLFVVGPVAKGDHEADVGIHHGDVLQGHGGGEGPALGDSQLGELDGEGGGGGGLKLSGRPRHGWSSCWTAGLREWRGHIQDPGNTKVMFGFPASSKLIW